MAPQHQQRDWPGNNRQETPEERIVRIETQLMHQEDKIAGMESELTIVRSTNEAVVALRELTLELRKDTDENTVAIRGLTKSLGQLSLAIAKAGWVIGGGIAVATTILGALYWLHDVGLIRVAGE